MKNLYALFAAVILLPMLSPAQTQVRFHTTEGEFIVEMYDSLAPITSGNFLDLVEAEFYDGVIFHRVINNFVIQGGDPTGTGSGGPGYTIPDEFDSTLSNVQKTLSMANSGPNTGGSQFFVNLVNNTYLDFDKSPYTSAHPVFGIVVDGWDVVQDISDVPVNSSNRPLTDVVMDSLRIISTDTADPVDTIPPAGISENDLKLRDMRIYPNPIGNQSVVSVWSTTPDKNAALMVYDHSGRKVSSTSVPVTYGQNRIPMNALKSNLSSGLYIMRLEVNGAWTQQRFLVH